MLDQAFSSTRNLGVEITIKQIIQGITRTTDYRHHYTDVFGAAILGTLCSLVTFSQYYDLTHFSMKQTLGELHETTQKINQKFEEEKKLLEKSESSVFQQVSETRKNSSEKSTPVAQPRTRPSERSHYDNKSINF